MQCGSKLFSAEQELIDSPSSTTKPSPVFIVLGNAPSDLRCQRFILANAIEKVGYSIEWIRSPEDVAKPDVTGRWWGGYWCHLHFSSRSILEKEPNTFI
jgi:hypothetical protein